MPLRRRRYQEEVSLLLTMMGCGIATLVLGVIVAFTIPGIILPAVTRIAFETARIALVPTITFTPTRTPTITFAPILPPTITGTPTPTSSSTPTYTPTATPIFNVKGMWYHNFGEMSIDQTGTGVQGKFFDGFSNVGEVFEGNLAGFTVVAKTQSGSFTVKFDEKANTFSGTWTSITNNLKPVNFCGARLGTAFPDGCSFAGAWFNNVGNNPKCDMTLKRIDLQVSGSYCNGTVNGAITYDSKLDETVLAGTWHSGIFFTSQGSFRFFMPGYDALEFVGNYNNSIEWCGWRSQFKQPVPCYRGPVIQ